MDLNHILLFLAVVSPVLVLVRTWRPGGIYRGWRPAAIIVLVITALAWLLFRDKAGFIGGAVWFVLLFLPAVGLRKVTELAARQRFHSARQLASLIYFVHPNADLRDQIQLFRTLESGRGGAPFAQPTSPRTGFLQQDRHWRLRYAPVIGILILLNCLVFVVEIYFGTDGIDLHRLGALEPFSVVIFGQYWRLLTALFLHAGIAHLLFNVFALYVLGPGLERTIGSLRFLAAYLISGIGSSVGVVALMYLRLIRPAVVVGASGCVMGIVGAWAGFLLCHRHVPRARERLMNILMIIGIQTAFDLTTPQVSSSAHICGLLTGFVVGLIIAPKPARSG